jgi:hypothetical protein
MKDNGFVLAYLLLTSGLFLVVVIGYMFRDMIRGVGI